MGLPSTLVSIFNYLGKYFQLPWGACSTTLGNIFRYPGEYVQLPWRVCSTTLGSIINYPEEYVQLPCWVCSITLGSIFNYHGESLKENRSTKVRKTVQRFQGDAIFQKSEPPQAAPLIAPCLKLQKNGKSFNIFKEVPFFKTDPPEAAPLLTPCLKVDKKFGK